MVGRDGVVVAEEDQVLVFVLAEGLGDFWVLDNIKYSLSLLLEPFVCRDGLFTLLGELCDVLD